jgi:hypothetical protein
MAEPMAGRGMDFFGAFGGEGRVRQLLRVRRVENPSVARPGPLPRLEQLDAPTAGRIGKVGDDVDEAERSEHAR